MSRKNAYHAKSAWSFQCFRYRRCNPLQPEIPSESKGIEELERTVTELKKKIAEFKKQSAPIYGKLHSYVL
jgi:hypothetical protein